MALAHLSWIDFFMAMGMAGCRYEEHLSDEEDEALAVLLLDRKRRRRWFDSSTRSREDRVHGNSALAIWTLPDVQFQDDMRLTRQQFQHVEERVGPELARASRARGGRPAATSIRDEILIFLSLMAHGAYAVPHRATLSISSMSWISPLPPPSTFLSVHAQARTSGTLAHALGFLQHLYIALCGAWPMHS